MNQDVCVCMCVFFSPLCMCVVIFICRHSGVESSGRAVDVNSESSSLPSAGKGENTRQLRPEKTQWDEWRLIMEDKARELQEEGSDATSDCLTLWVDLRVGMWEAVRRWDIIDINKCHIILCVRVLWWWVHDCSGFQIHNRTKRSYWYWSLPKCLLTFFFFFF